MIPDFVDFTVRNTWVNMLNRSMGLMIKKEDMFDVYTFKESAEQTSLTEEEIRDLIILIRGLHDAPAWNKLIWCHEGSIGQKVLVSEQRKTYLDLFVERRRLPEKEEDWDKEIVKTIQFVRVLGEYKSDEGIILYINNIKDCAKEGNAPEFYGFPYLTVARYVYLHELMHAFFNRRENKEYVYNPDQEETFAEFGALMLLDQLVKTTPGSQYIPEVNHASQEELEWAVRHVEGKTGALECYSRGAKLFKQYRENKEKAKQMLEAYPMN